MAEKQYIGVDLGGTRIRAALTDHALNLHERLETLTQAEEGLEPTLERIKNLVHKVMPKSRRVQAIGISAPGPSNPKTGMIVAPPNLPGWHNVPLKDIIQDEFNVPVFLGNDANVAALAEVAMGAAQNYQHAVYITVSTGVGGGVIIDGRMLQGREGLAAEIGHMPIVIDGGHVSSIEKEASGTALGRKAREAIERGESTMIYQMANGDLHKINGGLVGKAAVQGDALARRLVEHAGWIVGIGIVSLLHVFNPQIIVVGGGVTALGDLLFDPMRRAVDIHVIDAAYTQDLKIVPAGLGEDVSIYGAAALAITNGGQDDIGSVIAKLG
jgi:glucokinase